MFLSAPASSATDARPERRGARVIALVASAFVAFAGAVLPAAAAHADTDPAYLRLDAYLVDSTNYGSLNVDIKVLEDGLAGIADLAEVRVTAHRSTGGDVVKVSKSTGTVVNTIKAGGATTAPIVIEQRAYDEAGSGSWVKPNATWTWETVPTGMTVDLLDGAGHVLVTKSVSAPFTSVSGVTLQELLPAPPPMITSLVARIHDEANYGGVAVDVEVANFDDATSVTVRVDRTGASPVFKTSKAATLNYVNGDTGAFTTPVVTRPGTYNEAGSSSWEKPNVIWTASTVPTSVTVTIKRAGGADVIATADIVGDAADVLPPAGASHAFDLPTDGELQLYIPADAGEVTVDLGTPVDGAVTMEDGVTAATDSGAAVVIPAGTTVGAPEGVEWDGVITLPTVVTDAVVPAPSGGVTATVSFAVEVGSATVPLTFDTPVAIVMPDQSGKKFGFIQGDVFTPIDTECASNTPTLPSGAACYFDMGGDVVIWTTHFTTFVAYSLAAAGDDDGELAATGAADLVAPLGAAGALVALGLGALLAMRMRRRASVEG